MAIKITRTTMTAIIGAAMITKGRAHPFPIHWVAISEGGVASVVVVVIVVVHACRSSDVGLLHNTPEDVGAVTSRDNQRQYIYIY